MWRCVNYYKKIGVVEFIIRAGSLKPGDKILVYGKTTPADYCIVEEIQIEHESVDFVGKGQRCWIKLPFVVRPGDKLFRISEGASPLSKP